MGHPDNRLTQLDMLAVEAAKSSNKVTERAVLYDSLGSTPKSGVSSKKGAGSLVGALDTTTEKGRVQSKAVRSATSGPLQLRSAWESPWEKYEKIYDVELGGPVEVAVRKAPHVELVHVRAFAIQATAKTLHLFRQLQHRNIVTALEAFTTDSSLYIVLEHMPLSLERIIRSPAYPDERQLAAILGQVKLPPSIQESILTTAGRDRRGLPRSRRIRTRVSHLLGHPAEHGRRCKDW